ncbi:protein NRT1/ PTR FAMILY 4.6-like isoform X1 [Carex littledalei]|uniref:Protein NRT1/ PTR FAMILY 4.6-like isoform X1 n=1 Tax=Carex littledalei TaxID=544730 RepID=A0A833VQV9_9POAL|nr:protein NRT1/ PTR FAMILY 4.6-like isoform X1 [Carex littledalei]
METMVNWRGNQVNQNKHGGVRATLFLYLLVIVRSSINAANTNLVGFFRSTHNMTIARSVILSTNFGGATWILSILGAFVADSYIGTFKAIFFFGPFEILGYGLLAFQAHHSSLHPPDCNIKQNPNTDCESLQGWKTLLLYLGLFMVASGEGFMRSSTPAFGSDQFDTNDPPQMKQKIRFFDFAAFGTCFGATFGLVLVVWVQSFKGWNLGLGVCALFILSGLIIGATGTPFYRYRLPGGSPLTRILQVIVVAFKKRKIVMPEKNIEDPELPAADASDAEMLSGTKDLRFLDKALIYTGDTNSWSYCTISQVEETKSFLKMLPILFSAVLCYFPFALFFTLTAPVAATMNTHLGGIRIAPAALYSVPVLIQWIVLVLYNRLIIPLVGRYTSNKYSIVTTHLVRAGVGFVFAMIATIVAALVERKRRMAADPKDLSFLWMLPQFILVGLMEVTSFIELMEFFNNQLPERIKSLGSSMVFCIVGLSVWLDGAIVAVVSRVTRIGNDGRGWLDGMTFDTTRLDLFYGMLAVLEFVSLLNFAFWARKYLLRLRSQ